MFGDNQFRYVLLSQAACEAPLVLNIGGYRCCAVLSLVGGLSWPVSACACLRHERHPVAT